MADLVFQVTDGITTINFDGSGDYNNRANWRPNIARRRNNRRGNVSPFNDVTEEIPITIKGADIDDIDSNERQLIGLIDQAQLWSDGENVAPVVFKYRQQDSTLTNPVQCAVTGYAGPVLEHIDNDFMYANNNLARRSILRFTRRAEWLGDQNSGTAASFIDIGDPMSVSMSASTVDELSELHLVGDSAKADVIYNNGRGVIIMSGDSSDFEMFSAYLDMADFSGVNNHAPAASENAYGTATALFTGDSYAVYTVTETNLQSAKNFEVFIAARLQSGTYSGLMSYTVSPYANDHDFPYSRGVVITDTNIAMYSLGKLSLDISSVASLEIVHASGGDGSIEISHIMLMSLDNRGHVLGVSYAGSGFQPMRFLSVEHQALTLPAPTARNYDSGGDNAPLDIRGDRWLYTQGTPNAYALISESGSFRMGDGGTVADYKLKVVRYPAYLVPQ